MRRANPLTIIRQYHTDERRLFKALMLVLAKRPPDASPQASRAVSCPETTQAPGETIPGAHVQTTDHQQAPPRSPRKRGPRNATQ